jgi:hypothetical protein
MKPNNLAMLSSQVVLLDSTPPDLFPVLECVDFQRADLDHVTVATAGLCWEGFASESKTGRID